MTVDPAVVIVAYMFESPDAPYILTQFDDEPESSPAAIAVASAYMIASTYKVPSVADVGNSAVDMLKLSAARTTAEP